MPITNIDCVARLELLNVNEFDNKVMAVPVKDTPEAEFSSSSIFGPPNAAEARFN